MYIILEAFNPGWNFNQVSNAEMFTGLVEKSLKIISKSPDKNFSPDKWAALIFF